MLLELKIKDFAIIDDLTVTFGPGLNVFTGETGAGKSIIIGAIDLVLGDRAQADLIRSGSDEAQVEALFETKKKGSVEAILEEAGLEPSETLVIKRVVQRAGRNKVYINGSIATLVTLTEIGRHLIDIYGQSEHQSLTRREEHVEILDAFGGLAKSREEMAYAFADWAGLRSELERLRAHIKSATEDRELLLFQSKEIGEAGLNVGEDEELAKEKERLKNSEKLHSTTAAGEKFLYSDSGSVTERLGAVVKKLQETAKIDPALGKVAEELNSAMISVEEAAATLRDYASHMESDPARLEELEERLDYVQRLKRKYGGTVKDILEKKATIDKALEGVEGFEEQLNKLDGREGASRDKAAFAAEKLSTERVAAAKEFKVKLEGELAGLGMAGSVLEVEIKTDRDEDGSAKPREKGADHVSFLISTNKGEDVKPLARIASGGELSRIMLAIKGVSAKGRVPTLIFDEVDTGVSGRMAQVVGEKLRGVSKSHQSICITHLPQVAAFAETHSVVTKEENSEGRSVTRVTLLDGEERIDGLARMLGGARITSTTRGHAKELLEAAKNET